MKKQIPNTFYRVSIKGLILDETRTKFLTTLEEGGWWELPGGGLDWGENPIDGLRREIKEEMGLDVYESRFICEEMEDKGQEVEVDLTGE